MNEINQAIILAAGEGQRLRPFTLTKPKVMLSIGGKPLLQYVIEAAAENGLRDIIMIVGYKKEQIQDFFGSGQQFGVRINYVVQEQQLGTAHALHQARRIAAPKFVVISGDNFIDPVTISGLLEAGPNSVLVREQASLTKYGHVLVKDGQVQSLVDMDKVFESSLVNTGTYCFTREVFDFTQGEIDLPTALQSMLTQGLGLLAPKAKGTWFDVAYPWDILSLNDLVLRSVTPVVAGTIESGVSIKGPVYVGQDTVLRSNCYVVGPVFIGDNCEIGPNVCLLPSTSVGRNVTISPFTLIANSMINDNGNIGPGSYIQDSVIDRGCSLGGHFSASSAETEVRINEELHRVRMGAMIGEDCDIAEHVVARAGTIIGARCHIKALKVLSDYVPEGSLVI